MEVRDLSQLNSQLLSALALDFQSYRAGVILAEVVDIRIRLTLKDGYGLDFAVDGNRRRGANTLFAFVRGYGKGLAPCRIVEAGRVPLKAAVRLEQQFAVRFDGDGELRSRAERVFVEIPHARVLVLHAVAQQQSHDVFALGKVLGDVVVIVVDNLVGIGNVRGERALGDVFAVDEQDVKAQTRDGDFRFFRRGAEREAFAQHGRGNVVVNGVVFLRAGIELVGKQHDFPPMIIKFCPSRYGIVFRGGGRICRRATATIIIHELYTRYFRLSSARISVFYESEKPYRYLWVLAAYRT